MAILEEMQVMKAYAQYWNSAEKKGYSGTAIFTRKQPLSVQMGIGVRKSWLEKVGEKFPESWDDVKRVAVKFRDNDPDGNGKADTFGLGLEAAKPRDLIHMLDLFTFGTGIRPSTHSSFSSMMSRLK